MRLIATAVAATLAVLSCERSTCLAQPDPPKTPASRDANWTEDLDLLAKDLPAKHKNAFFHMPREEWESRLRDLREKAPSLTDFQIYAELRKLVAALGDGHTRVYTGKHSVPLIPRRFPLAIAWLSDGIYVASLPEEHAKLIGCKLVRIGSTPMDDAAARIGALTPFENESSRKLNIATDLGEAEILAALGLINDPDKGEFSVVDAAGIEHALTLHPLSQTSGEWNSLKLVTKPDNDALPISRRRQRPPFGHEVLADQHCFYVWYDQCSDSKDKTVAEFIDETIKALDGEMVKKPTPVERVVIDLRRNSGGNSALFMPMIDALSRRSAINDETKLSVLIGRRTFSSGMMNAYQCRNALHCRLIGEPTGGSPNGYGEVKTFELPHSGLIVQYSTKLFKGGKDGETTVSPDVLVEPDAAAFFSTRDVVLDAACK